MFFFSLEDRCIWCFIPVNYYFSLRSSADDGDSSCVFIVFLKEIIYFHSRKEPLHWFSIRCGPEKRDFVDKLCAQIKNIEIIICDDSEAGIILREAANRILKAEAWWNMDKNQTRRREYRFKIQRPSHAETWKSEFSPACPALYSLRSVKRLEIYEGFRIFKVQLLRIFQAPNVVCILCVRNILNLSCLCRSVMKTWICFLSTLIVFRKVNNLQIFELEK